MAARNVNLPIDNNGDVAGLNGAQFSSPAQLGGVLAKSAQCQECMVKQYFRYMAGRMETPADRPVILKALEAFRKSDFKFQEMMVALTLLREEGNAHVASNHQPR
jgi:hypothetical protein